MDGIPVLCVAGWSGSGKTTLIEGILPLLRERGLRVAVVKHDAHGFEMDREGKDSRRFTDAGATFTALASHRQTALLIRREVPLEALLTGIRDVELILLEGFKRCRFSQLGICRSGCGKGFTDDLSRFSALVTDLPGVHAACPVFELNDHQGVTEFIMQNMDDFTHFNSDGRARMVDVGEKEPSARRAAAAVRVLVSPETFALIRSGGMKKGDVLTVAQIAGIMGAKRTPEIIPMCHPIPLSGIDLRLTLDEARCSVEILAEVSCAGRTGVEMEALTAAATAALTVYDMCKAVQKDMVITDLRLMEKSGGVHGDYHREENA